MLAALGLAVLVALGLHGAMLAILVAFWPLSLLADRLRATPQPSAGPRPPAKAQTEANARAVIEATLESIPEPLIVLDRHLIAAANMAARTAFGGHIVGQDARVALRHPDAVRLLDMADGGTVTVAGMTGAGSLWQLSRRRIDAQYVTLTAHDRTAQADIGRAHTDFVANASHELRTPLSSVIGYIETLSEAPADLDPAITQRFLATVLREARRMQALVADLMSLSQLEAEKHDAPTTAIDMGQLAARVVGEFAPPPARDGKSTPPRVELARPDERLDVCGDAKQMEQLLRNLIDNALKYGDPAKPVRVRLDRGMRGQVALSVADSGAGISADHLPHLTRRFYRTDPGRSRQAGGTGLGLAIVKHIVERHRGKLDIASTLGVGTTVSVRLPLAPPASPAA